MKKLLTTTLVSLATIGLISCDKEEDNKSDVINLACKISSISSSSSYQDEYSTSEDSNESVFTYTGDQVSKVVETYSYEYCNWDGVSEWACEGSSGTDEYRFSYNGNELTKIGVYYDGQLEVEADVEYSDGKISKLSATYQGSIDEYRFIYTNGKLAKLENWDNYSGASGNLELYGYSSYTWTGENVTKEESFEVAENNGGRKNIGKSILRNLSHGSFGKSEPKNRMAESKSYSKTFTYDDKQNPLQGNPYNFLDFGAEFFGKNNAVTVSYTYYYDGGSQTYNYSIDYEYNDKGFPTSVSSEDNEPTLITYNCN